MLVELTLVVGLGNPTREYEKTRHNAGFWFLDELVRRESCSFLHEPRFDAMLAKTVHGGNRVLFLKPLTFMNHSGRAVAAVARYYRVEPHKIMVAHDDLDFDPGSVRLKLNGGHGGHNGVRNVISSLNSGEFLRLRIGVGRPIKSSPVLNYVLGRPGALERDAILSALAATADLFPNMIAGEFDHVMNQLHSLH